jgi:hypothetical protein
MNDRRRWPTRASVTGPAQRRPCYRSRPDRTQRIEQIRRACFLVLRRAGYRQAALTAPTANEYARALLEGAANLHGDKRNPPGCLGVQGALVCAPQSDSVRKELIRRRKIGEGVIRDRLKRAKAEGDLPPDAEPADLARYLSIVIYGITVQAAGGATRAELRCAAAIALQNWPKVPDR